jgi:hypothetical protein
LTGLFGLDCGNARDGDILFLSGVTYYVGMVSPPVGVRVSAGTFSLVAKGFRKDLPFLTPPVAGVSVSGSFFPMGGRVVVCLRGIVHGHVLVRMILYVSFVKFSG